MSFSRINEVLEMPNLIEVQKNSYQWFLDEGLKEVYRDVSAITDYTGNLVLDFIDYRLDDKPKYTVEAVSYTHLHSVFGLRYFIGKHTNGSSLPCWPAKGAPG